MGLDLWTSGNSGDGYSEHVAQWSYGGFGCFRERLAASIGITLDEMEGFRGQRSWSEVSDALKPLLNHSDCDGELSPEECAQVAPRLREIVSAWPDFEDDGMGHRGHDYDKIQGLKLADGMEKCARLKVKLLFR